jgi:hypothetical protein
MSESEIVPISSFEQVIRRSGIVLYSAELAHTATKTAPAILASNADYAPSGMPSKERATVALGSRRARCVPGGSLRMTLARPASFTCSALGKLGFGGGQVPAVALVAVLLDLPSHVVEQIARTVDAETFAHAPVGIPHHDRYPYGPGRRSLCHGFPFLRAFARSYAGYCVATKFLILCSYQVFRVSGKQRAADARHGVSGPDHRITRR